MDAVDFQRRFGGVRRLYGESGLARLQSAHVAIVGLGGVGSWAAEALARSALGAITLIDLDNVAESNVNRQIQALDGNFGKPKVLAIRERILTINPLMQVNLVEDFVTTENASTMLGKGFDVVVDCVDDASAKVAMVTFCKHREMALIVSGGAGGRLDPTRIQVGDLAHVHGDKLLAKVRNQLRRDHTFPKGSNVLNKSPRFGVCCIYSDEPVQNPESCESDAISGLNCAGYGSAVSVTATFGLVAAQQAINRILQANQ